MHIENGRVSNFLDRRSDIIRLRFRASNHAGPRGTSSISGNATGAPTRADW